MAPDEVKPWRRAERARLLARRTGIPAPLRRHHDGAGPAGGEHY
jgi:hypothetical protein